MKYLKRLISVLLLPTIAFGQAQESSLSDSSSYSNDPLNDFWSATQLDGKALDVMRLNASDDLDSSNVNFDQTDTWLDSSTSWRWATKTEMEAIASFFENDSSSFLTFNGGVWSPLTDTDVWNALIRGEVQSGEGHEKDGSGVAWGFTVNSSSFSGVTHRHMFNSSAVGAAPLLVRTPQQQCADSYGDVVDEVIVLQVATQSVDCANGSASAPFNNITQAQNAVRELISQGQNTSGITVEIQSGHYVLAAGLSFNSTDSGTENAPIIYKAAEGADVTFFGGKILAKDDFVAVSDGAVTASFVDQSAAVNIVEFDLVAAGITDYGTLVPHGFALEPKERVAPVMLYSSNAKMTLARWPNADEVNQYLDSRPAEAGHTGMVSYTSVVDAGPTVTGIDRYNDVDFNNNGGTFAVDFDRMGNWQNINEIFLDGVLGRSWEWTYNQLKSVDLAAKEITLKRGEISGIAANKGSYFFFENIIEEIDQPGEFYIDRSQGKLFFYPDEGFEQGVTILSTLSEPMVTVNSAKYLSFDGLNFDTGRNLGFKVTNSQQVNIRHCAIRNFSLGGISLTGTNNIISDSTISNVGGYGIDLAGGSEAILTKSSASAEKDTLVTPVELIAGNNTAIHNTIYNFAWDQKSQVPGIALAGVGNFALYNEIYDAPHFAVLLRNSTDNTVAYNYIHDLPVFHKDDGGAIYVGTGNFPHMYGNKINNNYFENVPTNGVYIDNFSNGVEVKNNAFNRVGYRNDTFSGININGGGDNVMKQNYFYDVERPIKYNKFAVNNVFYNYYDKILAVQSAFNAVGLETTPYKKYAAFASFLAFTDEDDFKYQSSSAIKNLSFNKDVTLDSNAQGSGVIEPDDNRWSLEDNVALSSVAAKHQNQFEVLDNLLTITPNEDSNATSDVRAWRNKLKLVTEQLPVIIDSIINDTAYTASVDADNDGVVDEDDAFPDDVNEWLDTDNDGSGNNADNDDDNDGVVDDEDAFPLDDSKWEVDVNYQPPVINIDNPETVNESEEITLDATTSIASEGYQLSYLWERVSGADIAISGTEARLLITAPQVTQDSELVIKLTITDGENSVSKELTITVKDTPSTVSANASLSALNTDSKLSIGETVNLDASSSTDADNSELNYIWQQSSGPTINLENANTSVASFVVPEVTADTNISFMVTVTNANGNSDSATVSAVIQAAIVTPVPTPEPKDDSSGGGSMAYLLLLLFGCRFRRS